MTDDRRCRSCRHWTPDDPGAAEGWGACRLAATDAEGESTAPESLASAMAAPAGFGAVLLTAPDFGCVQWAAKAEHHDPTPGGRP